MKKKITVSRPPSGLNIYLCREACEFLGGIGQRVTIQSLEHLETTGLGGIRVVLARAKHGDASYQICAPAKENSQHTARLTVTHTTLLAKGWDVYSFAPVHIEWMQDSNNRAIIFNIPAQERLDPAIVRARRSRDSELNRAPETSVDRLARVLKEFNTLLKEPEIEDVVFQLMIADDQKPMDLNSDCRIRAVRTVRRIFE